MLKVHRFLWGFFFLEDMTLYTFETQTLFTSVQVRIFILERIVLHLRFSSVIFRDFSSVIMFGLVGFLPLLSQILCQGSKLRQNESWLTSRHT